MSPSFAQLGVPAALVSRLDARGIHAPFPIQAASIPDALAGRDICGRAPTGSGKTLAFGLALVAAATTRAKPHRPTALVLVPTRELAAQVCGELDWLGGGDVRSVAVYGGVGYGDQRKALSRGVEVVVACPGRLEDLIASQVVKLDAVSIVVLDEADRMADMGFVPPVRRILDLCTSRTQTMLFSATLDGEVDHLVKAYQHKPARHEVAAADRTEPDVEHHFWRVDRANRVDLMTRLIPTQGRTIVFCRTRRGAERVCKQLNAAGVGAVPLHGDRSQQQRDRAIASFIDGRAQTLVATDVAARGIHVDEVTCVVHYDPPADHKDYTHRSGRTGRAGATGRVITFVWDEVRKDVSALQKKLGVKQRIDDVPDLASLAVDEPMAVRAETPPARHKAAKPAAKAPKPSKPAPKRHESSKRNARAHSAPKAHAPKAPTGTVKFFDVRKGYGFIAREGAADVFVHTSAVTSSGLRTLEPGQRVTFEVEPGRNGEQASSVRVL